MKFLFLLVLLFLFGNMFAAEEPGIIKGKIRDKKTKQAMEFVNVSVRLKNGDNVPFGTVTDGDGQYIIGNVAEGTYTLVVSFVGYNSVEKEIKVERTTVDLSDIFLAEDAQMLGEVNVVAQKAQMRFEIDKKVFNVDQNIAVTGGAASDVLSNIPSVEVDSEGEISLRGSSSVTIWINGKASGLSADNRAQILEQLPAESIERIEVLTNPSAKYSPEGTAGIINIILKQDRRAGYYGGVQTGANSRGGYNASANINFNSGKWDSYASIGFRHRKFVGGGYTDRLNTGSTDTTFLNQVSDRDGNMSNIFARFGTTYLISKQNQVNVGAFLMTSDGSSANTIDYLSNNPYSYLNSHRTSDADNDMTALNVEIGYKHTFSEKSNLDFVGSYNRWRRNETALYDQSSLYPDDTYRTSYQDQTNHIRTSNLEFQLDYVNEFNINSKLEAGYKGTLSHENSPIETYSGTTPENAVYASELYNRFIYDQDVHALYTTYSGKFEKFGYQIGVRGEYTQVETKSLAYGEMESEVRPYKTDYMEWFPSVFLSYILPDENEIQVNYTRRISRPFGGQLNSFLNITDSTNISYGNPYLMPEYTNSFELNYIKTWEKHTLSFSGYYRSTTDVIQSINFMEGDVMKKTFENIAESQSSGVELVAKNTLAPFCDLTTTLNLFYYQLDGFSYLPQGAVAPVIGEEDNDFSWNIRSIANFKLPKSFNLQVTGSYNARQVVAQGYRKANYTVEAGLKKSIGKKWSVNVNARDIFDSRRWKTHTSGENFVQDSERWRGGRRFNVSVSYSFGNMIVKKDRDKKGNGGGEEGEDSNGGGYDF